ncbi:MAG: response regulator [Rhodospirillaceae bacterium]|jgi:FixJ family two-component response regulator|nr:response regulator [Rhodospirillaceae bacterium]
MATAPSTFRLQRPRHLPTILLVDDDTRVTAGLGRILRDYAVVLSSNDGRSAYEIAILRRDLAFIVLDVTMPNYDAVEFLQDLSEAKVFTPIVIFSGWRRDVMTDVAKIAKVMGFPVLGIFEKPLEGRCLIKLLEK